MPSGTLPCDLAAASLSFCSCPGVIPIAAELQRAWAVGLLAWSLPTWAPVARSCFTLTDLLNASASLLLCVAEDLLAPPPASVPRLRRVVFLGIWSGQRALMICFATSLEDAMNAVFFAESCRSSAFKPVVSCWVAPAMRVTTSACLPLVCIVMSSTMFLMRTWGQLDCVACRSLWRGCSLEGWSLKLL